MDVIMPQLGESVDEGTVAVWHKKPGDPVAVDEILLEVETDKVATEVPALVAGTVKEILVPEGETAKVGTKLAVIEAAGGSKAPAPSSRASGSERGDPPDGWIASSASPSRNDASVPPREPARGALAKRAPDGTPLSPAVRRLLAHHGLDPADIEGTGRDGRIQRADVLAHLEGRPAKAVVPDEVEIVPFSSIRRRIAEHMVRSKATSAHVLQAIEVDFSRVAAARDFLKAAWRAQEGSALTYLPFIARAVCLALPEFPRLNALVMDEALHLHAAINLAFAVDLGERGLITPVLRHANEMRVPELARRIAELAERARSNRLTPDDLAGGTYSITNNGSFGTLLTAPIINQPQVAVLSTDGIARRPRVVADEAGERIEIRPVGVLAQSFDHRAVDGAYSGAYLRRLKEILESFDWAEDLF